MTLLVIRSPIQEKDFCLLGHFTKPYSFLSSRLFSLKHSDFWAVQIVNSHCLCTALMLLEHTTTAMLGTYSCECFAPLHAIESELTVKDNSNCSRTQKALSEKSMDRFKFYRKIYRNALGVTDTKDEKVTTIEKFNICNKQTDLKSHSQMTDDSAISTLTPLFFISVNALFSHNYKVFPKVLS